MASLEREIIDALGAFMNDDFSVGSNESKDVPF